MSTAASTPVAGGAERRSGPWKTELATGPLAGVRIVDLTINILGPVCTQVLGDMGADVIKVESPQGDQNRFIGPARNEGMSALYLSMNRNKRSVILDLKRAPAREALRKLVETADVFTHSMRPGAAVRLGVDYASIARINPRIVYGYAPGYNPKGPLRDRPAYDDVIQGESGMAALGKAAFGEPRYFPAAVADKLCGQILAGSIAMALYHRERTGEGQEVAVPMLECVTAFNLLDHQWGGVFEPPEGGLGYNRLLMPSRRPFATADGHMCIMASNDEQWHRLLRALDLPDMATDPRFETLVNRARNIEELYQRVAESMKRRSTEDWHHRLLAADIPHAPVRELDAIMSDAYFVETGFFRNYVHPSEGPMAGPQNPVQFSRTPASWRCHQPTHGEHTREILGDLGYDADAIAALT